MKKILVIGCCGSGKSTISMAVSEKRPLPLIHLDVLNWRDNWQTAPKEEFYQLLTEMDY